MEIRRGANRGVFLAQLSLSHRGVTAKILWSVFETIVELVCGNNVEDLRGQTLNHTKQIQEHQGSPRKIHGAVHGAIVEPM